MNKKIVLIAVFFVVLLSIFFLNNKKEPLASPVVSPLPVAEINQPEVIKYDASTDLKKELEDVNPEVLDKDFGTWVFAHCEKCIGIIYLRYKAGEVETIFNSLHTILVKYGSYLYNKFTVITPRKLRIRELPDS